jgi:hypothetical protein
MQSEHNEPTERQILKLIGKKGGLWTDLRTYLAEQYAHEPVMSIGKKEYDWTIRYRRSGKTLVTLMPEKGDFCVLVVLGKKEIAKAEGLKLAVYVKNVFLTAKQYHDGRWLWIRPRNKKDIESIKTLLTVKRKPKSV